jgi:hypothetical protein
MENAQIHFATGLLGAASFSSRNRLLWGLVVPLVTTDFVKKPMAFLG